MSGTQKQCYYALLEVDRKASFEDIRRAYKKQALLHHPDKNMGNAENADLMFKEIQNAYAILSDPEERAWYDAHRESILNGVDGAESGYKTDLYAYFTSKCYDGFGDDEGSFFSVYRKLFDQLIDDESEFYSSAKKWPRFGDSKTEWVNVSMFYTHWKNFGSFMTFAWKDEYKLNEIPDRASRRMAERLNQKARTSAKKEYVQTVHSLINFVYRRDPRVETEMSRRKEEECLKEKVEEQKRLEKARRRREANEKLWLEAAEKEAEEERERLERGDIMDGQIFEFLYEKQRQMEEMRKTNWRNDSGFAMLEGDIVDDNKELRFYCPVCKKHFKSNGQYGEHINSSKHKTKVRQLSGKGVNIEAVMKGGE